MPIKHARFPKALCFFALSALGSAQFASAAAVKLSGANEVPAVTTVASGVCDIAVAADGSLSGGITVSGLTGTMAHIHLAAPGKNGPVIVPLATSGDGKWVAPAGAKLTAEQLKSYQAGELYVNVHSAENKAGEIRAQLVP
jgi:hypothetical protein